MNQWWQTVSSKEAGQTLLRPMYYEAYFKFREGVGFILREEWIRWDEARKGYELVTFREKLWCPS